MIDHIAEYDRRLGLEIRLLNKQLSEKEKRIIEAVNAYFTAYGLYYRLSVEQVVKAIHKFSSKYVEDIHNFVKFRKFPYLLNNDAFDLTRIEYDIFLISSFFFTKHRFSILRELNNLDVCSGDTLFVGVGSGIELEFIKNRSKKINAYDLSISDFVKARHPAVNFVEGHFTGAQNLYGTAFAIELLEHLPDPFQLIRDIYESLFDKGIFVLTTVKNVPQFDHRYNFESDRCFEEQVSKIGFKLVMKISIPHEYRLANIDAKNTFYVLEKEERNGKKVCP